MTNGNETTDFAFLENQDFIKLHKNMELQMVVVQYDEKLRGLTRQSR